MAPSKRPQAAARRRAAPPSSAPGALHRRLPQPCQAKYVMGLGYGLGHGKRVRPHADGAGLVSRGSSAAAAREIPRGDSNEHKCECDNQMLAHTKPHMRYTTSAAGITVAWPSSGLRSSGQPTHRILSHYPRGAGRAAASPRRPALRRGICRSSRSHAPGNAASPVRRTPLLAATPRPGAGLSHVLALQPRPSLARRLPLQAATLPPAAGRVWRLFAPQTPRVWFLRRHALGTAAAQLPLSCRLLAEVATLLPVAGHQCFQAPLPNKWTMWHFQAATPAPAVGRQHIRAPQLTTAQAQQLPLRQLQMEGPAHSRSGCGVQARPCLRTPCCSRPRQCSRPGSQPALRVQLIVQQSLHAAASPLVELMTRPKHIPICVMRNLLSPQSSSGVHKKLCGMPAEAAGSGQYAEGAPRRWPGGSKNHGPGMRLHHPGVVDDKTLLGPQARHACKQRVVLVSA